MEFKRIFEETRRISKTGNTPEVKQACIEYIKSIIPNLRVNYDGNSYDDVAGMDMVLPNRDIKRIQLIGNNHTKISAMCNGMIVDTNTWKIISMPPRKPTTYINKDVKVQDYNVYPIYDGTLITIYYWNNEWVLASSKGLDLTDNIWMGTKTFKELFTEVLSSYKISLEKFKQTKSYTFVLSHPEYHPFVVEPSLTFIYSYTHDANDGNYNLPNELSNIANVNKGCQTIVNVSLDEINNLNKEAINNFLKDNSKKHYGFILRHKTGDKPDIMMLSNLMVFIKKYVYNLYNIREIEPDKKLYYIALYAYITHQPELNQYNFFKIFPHTQYIIDKFITHEDAIVNEIIRKNMEKTYNFSNTPNGITSKIIYEKICQSHLLKPFSKETPNLLHDLIKKEQYIPLYIKAFFNTK